MKRYRVLSVILLIFSIILIIVTSIVYGSTGVDGWRDALLVCFGVFVSAWTVAVLIFGCKPIYNGTLSISTREDGVDVYSLQVDGEPEDWAKMKNITLKVSAGVEETQNA